MRSARSTALLAALAVLSVTACKKHSDKPYRPGAGAELGGESATAKKPADKTPAGVKIVWDAAPSGGSPKFHVEGMKAKGDLLCTSIDCTISANDFPDGTKIGAGGNEEVSSHGLCHGATVELGDAIGAATPKDALTYDHKIDPKATLTITFPDGVKIESPVPPLGVKFTLERYLEEKLKDGTPVLFGKESDAAQATHSTMVLVGGAALGDDEIMGPAKTMKEVDRVAWEEALPKRDANKKCSGYTKAGEKGPGVEVSLMLVDWNVKLAERRTGKVIDEKKFEAPSSCPMIAQGGEATSYPDDGAVRAWLRSKK